MHFGGEEARRRKRRRATRFETCAKMCAFCSGRARPEKTRKVQAQAKDLSLMRLSRRSSKERPSLPALPPCGTQSTNSANTQSRRARSQSPAPLPTSSQSLGTGSLEVGRLRRPSKSVSRPVSPMPPVTSVTKSAAKGTGKGSKTCSPLEKWRNLPNDEPGSWVPPPPEAQLEAIGLQYDETALLLMSEGKSVPIQLHELYPERQSSPVEMNKLQRILQPLSPLFLPPLPAIPDTWMFDSKERPQSFKDYVLEQPPLPSRLRHTIYLLPLTEPGKPGVSQVGSLPDLRMFSGFLEAWFGLPCKILHYEPMLSGRGIAVRSNGHGNDVQYHAKDSLRQLRIRLPADGFCILGVTMEDLFDNTQTFVLSSISVRDRAGIFSFCRMDPAWYRVSCRMDFDVLSSDRPSVEMQILRGHG